MPRSIYSQAQQLATRYGLRRSFKTVRKKLQLKHWLLQQLQGDYLVQGWLDKNKLTDMQEEHSSHSPTGAVVRALERVVEHEIKPLYPDGLVTKYLPNGRKVSSYLTQLLRKNMFSDTQINLAVGIFGEGLIDQVYTITCKPKDILRMSLTKHFSSCRALDDGDYSTDCLQFAVQPLWGLVVVKDRGGQFLGRQQLKIFPRHARLNLYRAYGNIVPAASEIACQLALKKVDKLWYEVKTYAQQGEPD